MKGSNMKRMKSLVAIATLVLACIVCGGSTNPQTTSVQAQPTANSVPSIEIIPDVSQGKVPLTVHFDGEAWDADGEISSLEWDFEGDGLFEMAKTIPQNLKGSSRLAAIKSELRKEYTYKRPGIFHVLVRVTDDKGECSVSSATIQVRSDKPYLDVVPSSNPEFEYMAHAQYEAFFKSESDSCNVHFQMGDAWISYQLKTQSLEKTKAVRGLPQGNVIWYKNVFPSVDLRYTVHDNLLLEEFIVSAPVPLPPIEQTFQVHGAEFKINEDGSIGFYSGENLVFSILKPVMYEFDNPQNRSHGLHYEVVPQEGGKYIIKKVIDDVNWLKTAKYPLIIDSSTQGETGDPWEQQGFTPHGQYFENMTEHVDPLTGHLIIRQTDYTLPGRGLDLTVSRIYSTVVAYIKKKDGSGEMVPIATYKKAPTDLGYGWSLDFPWLELNEDQTGPGKYFHLYNGTQIATKFQNGVWADETYAFVMNMNADKTYTRYRKNGLREQYDAQGRFISVTDLNGNTITLTYSPYGISSITDTIGRVLQFTYSGGKLTSITDGVKTTTYSYSGGKLAAVTDPLGRATTYDYMQGNSFLITGVHYPSGGFSSYEYTAVAPAEGKMVPYKSSQSEDGGTAYYVYKVDSPDTLTWTSPKDINSVTASVGRPCVLQRNDGSLVMYYKDVYTWTEIVWKCVGGQCEEELVTHTEYWIRRSVSYDQQHWSSPENVVQVSSTTGNPVVIEKQDGSFIMYYKDKYTWTKQNCYWTGCPWECEYICETVTHTEFWIYRRTSSDGLIWGSPVKFQQTTLDVRNVAAIQKQDSTFLLCYTDKVGTSYYIRQKTSTDGITWGSPSNVTQVDSGTGNPALIQSNNGTVYLAYRKGDNFIYVLSNSGSWSSPVKTTAQAQGDPTLLTTPSEVIVIFKGTDGHCFRISSPNGTTWSSPSQIAPNKAISDPATAAREDVFYRVTTQYVSASAQSLVKVLEFSYEGEFYLPSSSDVVIRDSQTVQSSIHFEYDSKGKPTQIVSKDQQGTQTEKAVYTFSGSKVVRKDVYSGASPNMSYSIVIGYDDYGNVVYTRDPEGAEHYYSYGNTNSQNRFSDSKGITISLFSNQFYANSIPSNCHTLLVGEAFINNGKVQETYYKYDAKGNKIETKTLFPTRNYKEFSGVFTETETFEIDLTGLTITDGILVISSIAVPTPETLHETHSEFGKGWLNTGTWDGSYFMADYTRCLLGGPEPDCYNGQTKIGPFDHYPGTPDYTGYTMWVEDTLQYVQANYSAVVNEYPEKVEYNLNNTSWTTITTNLGSGTTSTVIPSSSLVQGVNTLQFRESNTYSTVLNWTFYLDQGATPESYTTSFTVDSYGNVVSATDAEGNTTTISYSATYNHAYPTTYTSPLGATISIAYNAATGQVLSVTDARGYTSSYQYDILGRLTKKVNPDLTEKEVVYNDGAHCITIYDELDHYVKKYFDGLGRITQVEYYMAGQVYASETYSYNYLHKVATYTDPLGEVYNYQYDSRGRPVVLTNPDATSRTIQYDDVNSTAIYSDENQHTREFKYNWKKQLLYVKEFSSQTTSFFTYYTYDEAGNLTSVTDANGNTTTYEYNSPFGLTEIHYPNSTTEVFAINKVGLLTSRTDANGNTSSFSYNAGLQLTAIQYADQTTVSFGYDLKGNRTSMTDPEGTSVYVYDSRNRLTSETRTIDGVQYTVQTAYDAASRPVSMTYPDGTVLALVYDDLNRLTSIPGYADFTYNAKSLVEHIVYGNGVETDFDYGCLCGRPTQIHAVKNGNELLNLVYTYDDAGNVTQLENGFFNPDTQTFETFTELYSYDWLNRLLSSTKSGGSFSYAYDEVGNMVSFNGKEYTYNAANEVVSCNDGTTFSYDQNGNTLSKTAADTWAYQYDYDDQLTQVQFNGQFVGQYVYDGDGRRVQKTELDSMQNSQTTVYVYNGIDAVYEKNTDTGIDALLIYGPTGLMARKVEDAVYYFHTDHLGSTRLTTDETGSVVTAVDYQPFGVNEGTGETHLFTGKEEDASGLYYFGARYYDPELGRFLTRDPISGSQTNPQSLNPYIYCLDNPLRYRDRWGMSSEGDGDCECIDDVQQLLDELDVLQSQLDYLDQKIAGEIKLQERLENELQGCLDFLNDMGYGIPGLVTGNDSIDWDNVKAFLVDRGLDLLGEILDKYAEKLVSEAFKYFSYAQSAIQYLRVIYCIMVVNNIKSSRKTVEGYMKLKAAIEDKKARRIAEIREKCPCALPPEGSGGGGGGGNII